MTEPDLKNLVDSLITKMSAQSKKENPDFNDITDTLYNQLIEPHVSGTGSQAQASFKKEATKLLKPAFDKIKTELPTIKSLKIVSTLIDVFKSMLQKLKILPKPAKLQIEDLVKYIKQNQKKLIKEHGFTQATGYQGSKFAPQNKEYSDAINIVTAALKKADPTKLSSGRLTLEKLEKASGVFLTENSDPEVNKFVKEIISKIKIPNESVQDQWRKVKYNVYEPKKDHMNEPKSEEPESASVTEKSFSDKEGYTQGQIILSEGLFGQSEQQRSGLLQESPLTPQARASIAWMASIGVDVEKLSIQEPRRKPGEATYLDKLLARKQQEEANKSKGMS